MGRSRTDAWGRKAPRQTGVAMRGAGSPIAKNAMGGPAPSTTFLVVLILGTGAGVMSCRSWFPAGAAGGGPMPGVRGGAAEVPTTEPDLRVRIRSGLAEAKIGGPSRFIVSTDLDRPLPMTGPLMAAARDGSVVLLDGDGRRRTFNSWTPVTISAEPASSGAQARVIVDGAPYPGRLRLQPRAVANGGGAPPPGPRGAPGVFDIIEMIGIESYLPGVVSGELIRDWPLAAFEAQAVCARTYALHQRHVAMRRGRDFDLEADTQDQVYKGAVELPVAAEAVRNTRGVVVTWNGRLVRTYYASTCGGRTGSAADVWPTTEGYEYNLDKPIQAHPREHWCTQSSLYRWEVTREREELLRRVREWGKGNGSEVAALDSLVSVTVARTNRDGRPATYRLRDAKGKPYEIRAEDLRLAANQSVQGLPDVVLRKTRLASNDFDVQVRGESLVIRGRGFGHGVGMCQWCLKGMADRGMAWREMVERFYPDARLERAY